MKRILANTLTSSSSARVDLEILVTNPDEIQQLIKLLIARGRLSLRRFHPRSMHHRTFEKQSRKR